MIARCANEWTKRLPVPAVCGAIALLLLGAPLVEATAAEYKVPANRKASDILPAELIQGPNYRIRDEVVSYGYMHHWTLDSDFGTFQVTGDGALRKLIREIYAIAALKEVSQSEAFADSVVYAAKQPVELAGKMITDPVDTVSALPRGVFQIFENVGTAVTEEKDPSEDSRLKNALFVSSWKRDFAAANGVDVYSSNKILQEQLNKVGWASAVGGLGVSGALMAVGGPAAMAVSNTRLANQVTEVLKEEPASRLRIINKEKLIAMGVSEELADRYLDHPSFTPRHDTVIAAALTDLTKAKGRAEFVEAILAAQDEVAANFYMNMAQTLQGYNETASPITDISIVGGFVVARASNGSALIPFPLDHGVWRKRAEGILRHLKQTYEAKGFRGKYELWVAGTVSPRARQGLGDLKIEVTENVDERVGFLD